MKIKKIAIVQRVITDYRVNFFNTLNNLLKNENIELTIYAGNGKNSEKFKDGLEEIKCAKRVNNYYILNTRFYYQNIYSALNQYDIVIVEQANSAILNYLLLFQKHILNVNKKFAFWGHGATLSKKNNSLSNNFKKLFINKSDYWFGYTEHTRKILNRNGVKNHKISIINNSIDMNIVDKNHIQSKVKNNRVVFCSRLYNKKKIPFIIESCIRAKKEIKDLELFIIGDGPDFQKIKKLVNNVDWIKMTGALFNEEKRKILKSSQLMVLPSFLGLSILDAFSSGLPVLTTNLKNHGPEISYLENGINGLKTNLDVDEFSNAIVNILKDKSKLNEMSKAALETANKFTVEKMAENFVSGIKNIIID